MTFIKVNTEDPALKEVAKEHVKVLPTFKFFKVRPPHLPLKQHAGRCVGRRGADCWGESEEPLSECNSALVRTQRLLSCPCMPQCCRPVCQGSPHTSRAARAAVRRRRGGH